MKSSFQFIAARVALFFVSLTASALAFAQGDSVSVKTTKTTSTETSMWYMQPWAWVLGGVILIIIIMLAARGGRSSDKVSVTRTTTVRDSDTV